MLAAAALRSGFKVNVLDRFGDRDTRDLAGRVCVYRDRQADFCNRNRLLELLVESYTDAMQAIVIGTGFESCPGLLEELNASYPVIGNDPASIESIKDPRLFFPALKELDIPCPDTRPSGSPGAGRWLRKGIGASGGRHVRELGSTDRGIPENSYLQAYIPGMPGSVLFLADGKSACCVGLNRTWTVEQGSFPFTFAGAVTRSMDAFRQMHAVQDYIRRLVIHFSLRGLCGLDFIEQDDRVYVLEVNPRPTATL
ncbi:MAG: ATP-grasp domain-containing protein [Thiotrichales bacterium]|nr:ATP-grasp domain-containing protein [Thiotrichales bacterium]